MSRDDTKRTKAIGAASPAPAPTPTTPTPRPRYFQVDGLVPSWALGETARAHVLSHRERKLTAAVYAKLAGVVATARATGRLPDDMPAGGGLHITLRLVVQARGLDVDLTDDERAVHAVLVATRDVRAGCAALLDLDTLAPTRRNA